MVTDTQQVGGRCHIFDNYRMHTRGNFARQPLPTVANFHGVLNFMIIRAVMKMMKISTPQKLSAMQYVWQCPIVTPARNGK